MIELGIVRQRKTRVRTHVVLVPADVLKTGRFKKKPPPRFFRQRIAARMATEHLAESLRPIYDLECRLGNEVDYIAEPAGTRCPLAVAFKRPLHHAEIAKELTLPTSVQSWESRDPHYPIEAGYQCLVSRHTVAGPLD